MTTVVERSVPLSLPNSSRLLSDEEVRQRWPMAAEYTIAVRQEVLRQFGERRPWSKLAQEIKGRYRGAADQNARNLAKRLAEQFSDPQGPPWKTAQRVLDCAVLPERHAEVRERFIELYTQTRGEPPPGRSDGSEADDDGQPDELVSPQGLPTELDRLQRVEAELTYKLHQLRVAYHTAAAGQAKARAETEYWQRESSRWQEEALRLLKTVQDVYAGLAEQRPAETDEPDDEITIDLTDHLAALRGSAPEPAFPEPLPRRPVDDDIDDDIDVDAAFVAITRRLIDDRAEPLAWSLPLLPPLPPMFSTPPLPPRASVPAPDSWPPPPCDRESWDPWDPWDTRTPQTAAPARRDAAVQRHRCPGSRERIHAWYAESCRWLRALRQRARTETPVARDRTSPLAGLVFAIGLMAALLVPVLLPPAAAPSSCRQFAFARTHVCATTPPAAPVSRLSERASGSEEMSAAPVVRDAQVPGYGR